MDDVTNHNVLVLAGLTVVGINKVGIKTDDQFCKHHATKCHFTQPALVTCQWKLRRREEVIGVGSQEVDIGVGSCPKSSTEWCHVILLAVTGSFLPGLVGSPPESFP